MIQTKSFLDFGLFCLIRHGFFECACKDAGMFGVGIPRRVRGQTKYCFLEKQAADPG